MVVTPKAPQPDLQKPSATGSQRNAQEELADAIARLDKTLQEVEVTKVTDISNETNEDFSSKALYRVNSVGGVFYITASLFYLALAFEKFFPDAQHLVQGKMALGWAVFVAFFKTLI